MKESISVSYHQNGSLKTIEVSTDKKLPRFNIESDIADAIISKELKDHEFIERSSGGKMLSNKDVLEKYGVLNVTYTLGNQEFRI